MSSKKLVICYGILLIIMFAICIDKGFENNNISNMYDDEKQSQYVEISTTEVVIEEIVETEEIQEETDDWDTTYRFSKADPENLPMPRWNIWGYEVTVRADKHSRFIGQAWALFGEPDYMTNNYEDICSWAVLAEDKHGNRLFLEIYHGPSGPAIGGQDGSDYEEAAEELARLINRTKPVDYHWECVYEDIGVTLEMGVKDGRAYYNTLGLWDDE